MLSTQQKEQKNFRNRIIAHLRRRHMLPREIGEIFGISPSAVRAASENFSGIPSKRKKIRMGPELWERISENVYPEPNSGCWFWMGEVSSSGYGKMRVENKDLRAHRVTFWLRHGHFPEMVRHTCDIRCCVNPDHLLAGDAFDNAHDAVSRGRQARGERQGASKLTESQIEEIRALCDQKHTYTAIGEMFGVNRTTIARVHAGKTWGWKWETS